MHDGRRRTSAERRARRPPGWPGSRSIGAPEHEGHRGEDDAAHCRIGIEPLRCVTFMPACRSCTRSGGFLTLRFRAFCRSSSSLSESWTDLRRLAASATRSREALTTARSVSAFLTVSSRFSALRWLAMRVEHEGVGDRAGADAGEADEDESRARGRTSRVTPGRGRRHEVRRSMASSAVAKRCSSP